MVHLVREADALQSLRPGWNALLDGTHSPMQQFIWMETCAASFGGDETEIVTLGDPTRPYAIAPLRRRRGRLELLGECELQESTDFIYADQCAATELARTLFTLKAPIYLERVPADSLLVAALGRLNPRPGMVIQRPRQDVPYTPLDASWCEPEQFLNSGRRSDIRRARRRAEEIGPVSFEISCPSADEVESLLEQAFQVEDAGWKGQQGSSLKRDLVRGEFYRRYAQAAASTGVLRLCFLRIAGQAVAMQFAIECGNRFWLLKIGYDQSFARCSPGILLMLETLRYSARKELDSYEFLGVAEDWTQIWAKTVRPCVALRLYPHGARGFGRMSIDCTRSTMRKARLLLGLGKQ
jgi:CelD/BcsL family acetyltransferase involved in cellulose biosynthesis